MNAQDRMIQRSDVTVLTWRDPSHGITVWAPLRVTLLYGAVCAVLAILLYIVAGASAVIALVPVSLLLPHRAAVRIRIDEHGLRTHALGFLPLARLVLVDVRTVGTGEAILPWFGSVAYKSGAALPDGGTLEHAVVGTGPALIAEGPHRLTVVVSAGSTARASTLASTLLAYKNKYP